jgi:diguanylate cyclase (GGDEF)-like protein/PAS domain S-box-containing protein
MNPGDLRILNVEDSDIDAELCARELARAGLKFVAERVWTRDAFEAALRTFSPNLILCDFGLPGAFDGLTALDIVRERAMDIPFIFVSGTIGEDRAVEALKRGATDYVLKERMERLTPVVMRALQEAHERAALRQAEDALRESEERFRQLAENIHDAFFLVDAGDQRVLYVSPAYEEIWGESCASLYANPGAWSDIIHPADRERIASTHAGRIQAGRYDTEYRIVRRDGSIRWIRDRAFPILDENGHLRRIAGVATDITARKRAEQRIERLNRLYAVLSGINTLIVRASDRDQLLRQACRIAIDPGRFSIAWIGLVDRDANAVKPVASAGDVRDFFDSLPLALEDTGTGGHGLIGQAIRYRKPAISNDIRHDPKLLSGTRALEERGINSFAVVPLLRDNEAIGVLALYAADTGVFDDEEIRLLTELAGDISFALDYLAKGEKINYLAFYDAVTGLPNRALFTDRLNHQLSIAAQNGSKLALVLCDLKRFRLINESFGRQAGDAVLREIAARAKKVWPNTDSIAHIHADCFAGTFPDLKDEAKVAHALEKALKAVIGAPYVIGEKELSIAATAGIAVFPADGGNAEDLLRNSETALKKAKATGERYLFYQPSMNARVADTLLLDSKLRRAMVNEEFVLYYQPKLNLATNTLSGLEALIRWNDPESGIVWPSRFIPLLEETGMILDVGAWAIRQALADRRRWKAQGLQPPRVAVNVSAIQLRQANFVDSVRDAIESAGVAEHGLDLEVTETLIMEDIESSIEKLNALRGMDVEIAIDDFGTGYSSLSYLARLPVQLLKIDRSFIITMAENSDSMTIVAAIISLAHSLNIRVIAEGVETGEQSQFLRLMKCDEMQGYLFSKPLPFDAITALLKKG